MDCAVWIEEFARAAEQVDDAIECVRHLAHAKRVAPEHFALQLARRAEEYLKRQLELGRLAKARLSARPLPSAERARIYREVNIAIKRLRRVALYVQAQIFQLDRIASGASLNALSRAANSADGSHAGDQSQG